MRALPLLLPALLPSLNTTPTLCIPRTSSPKQPACRSSGAQRKSRQAASCTSSSSSTLDWMGTLPAGYLMTASVGLGVVAAAATAFILLRTSTPSQR